MSNRQPTLEDAAMNAPDGSLEDRLAELETRLAALTRDTERARARGEVENLFSTYMYLHNAFRDEEIIPLWVASGTPGIHAQYSNVGVYTTWESVTEYHRGRPTPPGKLILHYTTTPVIEVAEDGETAKGVWIMTGLESGLTDPAVAEGIPPFFFAPEEVLGKKVWAHWVWCRYGVDFLKQDGVWRIWHFRCYEVARAPFDENWISFSARDAESFDRDLMYFGEDGKPRFMPTPDGPATRLAQRYRPDESQVLEPRPPVPYRTFAETFEY
jgi:SnoaL-like protein